MNFENQVAIVTGSASGMGLLFAENFAALGGQVVLCDINQTVIEQKAIEITERGAGRAIAATCDIRDYEAVKSVCECAVNTFGKIDLVANFAGGTATRMCGVDREKCPEFPDVPIEVYDWGIDVNLKGPFYFAHASLKYMREAKRGLIINIGSITGAEGDGYGMDYPTSKAGLMYGLTKSIARFGARYGIRCVCVSPGPVLTRAAMAKMKTLLGRAAKPQEIVDLIMYVASDQASFMTGINILIDGGRNIMKDKGM